MHDDERFADRVRNCSLVELPVLPGQFSQLLVEGSGKRLWVRALLPDGACYSIELMGGVVEVFASGTPVITSSACDDLEWTTSYSGPRFTLEKAQIWVYSRSSDDILREFAQGPKRPIGQHARRLWASAFTGAQWVRLWISG